MRKTLAKVKMTWEMVLGRVWTAEVMGLACWITWNQRAERKFVRGVGGWGWVVSGGLTEVIRDEDHAAALEEGCDA